MFSVAYALVPVSAGASLASLITSAVAYTREPNQVKPSLPLFWDCEWSHEYDRWYYINEKCALYLLRPLILPILPILP